MISVILSLGGLIVKTKVYMHDAQDIRSTIESELYQMRYGENPIRRWHISDTHKIYWHPERAMWIKIAHDLVGENDQKFFFENGDEIYKILKKYIPTKPDSGIVRKFATPMFSNCACKTQ